MGETTAAGARCPRCSAAVRPGAPWCTQCYAPAGGCSVTDVAPEQGHARRGGVRVAEQTPAWPCSACSQPNDLADAACAGCGTPFLAAVRDERPTAVLPGVGDLLAMSPGRRVGLAVGLVVVFLLVVALLALLPA